MRMYELTIACAFSSPLLDEIELVVDLQYSVIARISNENTKRRESNVFRSFELISRTYSIPFVNKCAISIKFFNTGILPINYEHVVRRIDSNTVRDAELPISSSSSSPFQKESTIMSKLLNIIIIPS